MKRTIIVTIALVLVGYGIGVLVGRNSVKPPVRVEIMSSPQTDRIEKRNDGPVGYHDWKIEKEVRD